MTPLALGHLDIASHDPSGSARFFAEMFGWTTEVHEREGYTSFSDGRVSGGFPDLTRGFAPVRAVLEPGDVLPYVEVPSLDSALEQARALGADILLEPTEAAPGAWLAILRTPQGTKVALSFIEPGTTRP